MAGSRERLAREVLAGVALLASLAALFTALLTLVATIHHLQHC